MPAELQLKMESAFGADFSAVRVHPSSSRAVALGALAYTQGSEIQNFAKHGRAAVPPSLAFTKLITGNERHHIVSDKRILLYLDKIAIEVGDKKVVDANGWAHAALEAEVKRTKEKIEQLENKPPDRRELSTHEEEWLKNTNRRLPDYEALLDKFGDGKGAKETPMLKDPELEDLLLVLEWMPPNLVINRQVRRYDPGDKLDIEALVLHPDLETRKLLAKLAACLEEIKELNELTLDFDFTTREDDRIALLAQALDDREKKRTTELLTELVKRPDGGTGRGLMKPSTSKVKQKLGDKNNSTWKDLLLKLLPSGAYRNQ